MAISVKNIWMEKACKYVHVYVSAYKDASWLFYPKAIKYCITIKYAYILHNILSATLEQPVKNSEAAPKHISKAWPITAYSSGRKHM